MSFDGVKKTDGYKEAVLFYHQLINNEKQIYQIMLAVKTFIFMIYIYIFFFTPSMFF